MHIAVCDIMIFFNIFIYILNIFYIVDILIHSVYLPKLLFYIGGNLINGINGTF